MSTSYPRALAALARDLRRRGAGALGVEIEHDDLAPFGGEGEAIRLAEASRAARDQRRPGPLMPRSMLFALELGGALLEESLDPLARILRLENLLEGAHLDLDGLIDGRLDAIVHRLDDEAGRDGRPLGDLARQGLGVVESLALPWRGD
jgi:hypothetical protein